MKKHKINFNEFLYFSEVHFSFLAIQKSSDRIRAGLIFPANPGCALEGGDLGGHRVGILGHCCRRGQPVVHVPGRVVHIPGKVVHIPGEVVHRPDGVLQQITHEQVCLCGMERGSLKLTCACVLKLNPKFILYVDMLTS